MTVPAPQSVPPPEPLPPRAGLRQRAGWTLGDQVLSSGTNAALSIVIARSVDASGFGAFSVAFVAFSFLIGLSRATVTDPLIVRFSSAGADLAHAGRRAAGTALVLGAVAGLVSGAAALLLGGQVGAALLGLSFVLPGLLVQDAWRQLFFAAGRPRAATVNDAVWAASQVVLIGGVLVLDRTSVFALTVAWGAAASVAALAGALQAGGAPHPRASWAWLREHRDLNVHLAAGYALNMGAVHVTMALVGVIGGLTAVGALRAAQVLLGPLQVLFAGATSFALPLLSRRAAQDVPGVRRPALLVSALAAMAATGWLVVLLLLPDALGQQLLGDSWDTARQVLPAVGAMMVLIAGVTGATLALKALSIGGRLLTATLVQAPLILVLGCTGAYLDGARGAALGLAVAHVGGFAVQWSGVWRVTAR